MTRLLFLVGYPDSVALMVPSGWPGEKRVFSFQQQPLRNRDDEMAALAQEWRPDAIIYESVLIQPQSPAEERLGIPDLPALHRLKGIAPLVHLCFDGGDIGWRDALLAYDAAGCFSCQVTLDGCKDWPLAGKPNALAELTPVPFSPGIPIRPLADRPVPLGFAGSVAHERVPVVTHLQQRLGLVAWNREVSYDGDRVPYYDYCQRLASFRLSLNVAWSGTNSVKHVKARVSESAWAGCCLLETEKSKTADWFVPGEDYVEYGNPIEAEAQAQELMSDLPRAQQMASNLRRKVVENHSPAKFWERVLSTVGVKC